MAPIILQVPKQRFGVFLACSLLAFLAPLLVLRSPLPGATAVAILGFGFLSVCAIFFSIKLMSSAPMLVIDDTGLTDNSSAVSAGFLLWREISRVEIVSFIGEEMLSIHLVDAEGFLSRINPFKRALMRINAKLVGGALVNLSMRSLVIDRQTLLAALRARLPASGV
ncbi:MAG TPA: STM3941 family protein [Telluria sp.]|jgi:hypothetical protein